MQSPCLKWANWVMKPLRVSLMSWKRWRLVCVPALTAAFYLTFHSFPFLTRLSVQHYYMPKETNLENHSLGCRNHHSHRNEIWHLKMWNVSLFYRFYNKIAKSAVLYDKIGCGASVTNMRERFLILCTLVCGNLFYTILDSLLWSH